MIMLTLFQSHNYGTCPPVAPSSLPSSAVLLQPSPIVSEPSYNPDHTSLLCPEAVEAAKASQAAGFLAAPMPFGDDRQASIASYDALPTLTAATCEAPEHFHKITNTPNHYGGSPSLAPSSSSPRA